MNEVECVVLLAVVVVQKAAFEIPIAVVELPKYVVGKQLTVV